MEIRCLRKDEHVLIPNWNQGDDDAIRHEVSLLMAIGYLPSKLTEREIAMLQANVLSSES